MLRGAGAGEFEMYVVNFAALVDRELSRSEFAYGKIIKLFRRPAGRRRERIYIVMEISSLLTRSPELRHHRVRIAGHSDDEQLVYAVSVGRTLYTFNVSDFMTLHSAYMAEGRAHAGIIFGNSNVTASESRCGVCDA